MKDEEAFIAAIRANPEDDTPRLVFADWLDEQERSGGEYLRAEVNLYRAAGDGVAKARKEFFKAHNRTDRHQRERFEQPDMLRVTPTPFPTGWYGVGLPGHRAGGAGGRYKLYPYQLLPNLFAEPLAKDWAWLTADDDYAEDKNRDISQLNGVKRMTRWAKSHHLAVPAELRTLVGNSPRCWTAVAPDAAEREIDAGMVSSDAYMKVGDGWAIPFMFDMFYGDFENQLTWSMYLVPKTAYHCIVVSEPQDDEEANNGEHLANPAATYWCAPSLRAFIYRWWMETHLSDRLESKKTAATLKPEEQAYAKHYASTKPPKPRRKRGK